MVIHSSLSKKNKKKQIGEDNKKVVSSQEIFPFCSDDAILYLACYTTQPKHVSKTIKLKKKKKMKKGTLNREGLKSGIWWPCSNSSNLTKVKEIHLIGRLRRGLNGIKSSERQRPRNSSQPSFLHLCVKSPESTNQKNQRKKVKNYTFTVEEIVCFHLWYTKYVQSHAEDCLHERPEPVSFAVFDMCKSQKCRKFPAECLSFPG